MAELLIDRMDPNKIINLTMSDTSPLHFVCKLKVEKYTIVKKLLEKNNLTLHGLQNGRILIQINEYFNERTVFIRHTP